MFNFLKKLFSKIWKWLRKILAIILVIVAVVLFFYALFVGLWIYALYGLLALAAAFLVDAETASEVIGKIGDAIGDAAGAVAEFVGDVAGGVAKGFLSSPFGLAVAGVGIWLLFGKGKDDQIEAGSEGDDGENVVPESEDDGFLDISSDSWNLGLFESDTDSDQSDAADSDGFSFI
jgi:hypothetical protein